MLKNNEIVKNVLNGTIKGEIKWSLNDQKNDDPLTTYNYIYTYDITTKKKVIFKLKLSNDEEKLDLSELFIMYSVLSDDKKNISVNKPLLYITEWNTPIFSDFIYYFRELIMEDGDLK